MKTTTNPKEALINLVEWSLDNRRCSTAYAIREMLLSLYSPENKCALAEVQGFGRDICLNLCALLTGMGRDGGVYDYEIRKHFIVLGGEVGLRWFMEPLGELEDDLVANFMAEVPQ